MFNISIPRHQLNRLDQLFSKTPKRIPAIIRNSLNKTATSVRKDVVRELATEFGLKSSTVRDKTRIVKATLVRQQAIVKVYGQGRVPLIDLGARQTRRGVSYRHGKGRRLTKSAFIATMSSGHRGVFARVTPRRLPIRELFAGRLGEYLRDRDKIERDATKKLSHFLQQEIRRALARRR